MLPVSKCGRGSSNFKGTKKKKMKKTYERCETCATNERRRRERVSPFRFVFEQSFLLLPFVFPVNILRVVCCFFSPLPLSSWG